jgi:hypothetical protein
MGMTEQDIADVINQQSSSAVKKARKLRGGEPLDDSSVDEEPAAHPASCIPPPPRKRRGRNPRKKIVETMQPEPAVIDKGHSKQKGKPKVTVTINKRASSRLATGPTELPTVPVQSSGHLPPVFIGPFTQEDSSIMIINPPN